MGLRSKRNQLPCTVAADEQVVSLGSAALALALSAACHADQSVVDDLGKSWPNVPDVSASPSWHAYVFDREGVRYIQLNDAAGQLHVALAAADGQFLVLPMGNDAAHVRVLSPDSSPSHGTVVYRDDATEITVLSDNAEAGGWTIRSLKPSPPALNGMPIRLMCDSACSNQVKLTRSPP